MRIGIMGGTFDPIHRGHIDVALEVLAALHLDRVMLLPSGDPPHKAHVTDKMDRLKMVEIAASKHAGLFASDVEINREGITYTVDTLTALTQRHPDTEWVYIIGADTLNVLDSWRNFSRIVGLCTFAAVGRPGCDQRQIMDRAREIEARFGTRIVLMSIDGPNISSTEIRTRVAEGRDIHGMTPDGVAAYIQEHGLYLCGCSETELLAKLKGRLSAHRFLHTLGVAETAFRLAPRYGVPPYRARLAGLLHDCAKAMSYDDMRILVAENVPDADALELESAPVLHAPAGRVLAEREFDVKDPMILDAIRRHTLGGPAMTAMDALIYVADFIEPGREDFPGLAEARDMAERDIFQAMRICASLTADYLKARGQSIHPRTIQLLNSTKGGATI